MHSNRLRIGVLGFALSLSGCWSPFHKRVTAPPPPPPQPQHVPLPVPAPPQRIEPPPEIVVPPEAPKANPPELPHPRPERRENPPPPSTPKPSHPVVIGPPAPTAEPEPPPAPVRVPELVPMLSEDERKAYQEAIDASVAKSMRNLETARQQRIDDRRRDMITRAEGFLTQARELRQTDPVTAKSLALRAELLSSEAAK